mmetsp:Transcript_3206/g.10607  ORF Transcript_3206/g.10607 Transcript_3206/m.10607 type:complete len:741 (-) Transcript_3206:155-2377(-)
MRLSLLPQRQRGGSHVLALCGVSGLRLAVLLVCLALIGALFSVATNVLITHLATVVARQKVVLSACCGILAVLAADLAGTAATGVVGGGVPEIRALYTGGLRGVVVGEGESDKDDARVHPFLSLKVMVAKLTSLIFAAGGGLPVGREGPFIHAACCAAAALTRTKAFKGVGDPRTLRSQILLCAVAVGVAAAFRTPVAGALFAIEVIAVDFNVSAFWKLVTSSTACVLATLCCASGGADPWYATARMGNLSLGGSNAALSYAMLRRSLVVGIVGGCVGVVFVKLNVKARSLLWRRHTSRLRRYATAASVAAVVAAWPALIAVFFLAVDAVFARGAAVFFGRGQHHLPFFFSESSTNSSSSNATTTARDERRDEGRQQPETLSMLLASIAKKVISLREKGAFELSSDAAMRSLLKADSVYDALSLVHVTGLGVGQDEISPRLLIRVGIYLALALRELLLAPLALALPLTAGSVKPLFVLGAFVGAFVDAFLFRQPSTWVASGTPGTPPLGATALLGAAATCSSVTALTSAVALLEMTASHSPGLALPVLAAAIVSKAVAVSLTSSSNYFYDVQADRKHYRALPRATYDLLACATVRDACAATLLDVALRDGLSTRSDVRRSVELAKRHGVLCLPVVDRKGRFAGGLRLATVVDNILDGAVKPVPLAEGERQQQQQQRATRKSHFDDDSDSDDPDLPAPKFLREARSEAYGDKSTIDLAEAVSRHRNRHQPKAARAADFFDE